MQEYSNHPAELFMTDEEQKETETNEKFQQRLLDELTAQMDNRLKHEPILDATERTFFEDSDLAKKALLEAMKKGRK